MRNRVIHRNSPFRLLAAALAVLTLTLLAVMVPCEGEAHAAAPIKIACVGDSLRTAPNPVAARRRHRISGVARPHPRQQL